MPAKQTPHTRHTIHKRALKTIYFPPLEVGPAAAAKMKYFNSSVPRAWQLYSAQYDQTWQCVGWHLVFVIFLAPALTAQKLKWNKICCLKSAELLSARYSAHFNILLTANFATSAKWEGENLLSLFMETVSFEQLELLPTVGVLSLVQWHFNHVSIMFVTVPI